MGVMPWQVIHMLGEIRLGRQEERKSNENHRRELRHTNQNKNK